jgi:hypothetical protein
VVDFLNAGFPGCTGCPVSTDCAGFVPHTFRPTACALCGHERDLHTLARDYGDATITNAMLQDFRDQIEAVLQKMHPEEFLDQDD